MKAFDTMTKPPLAPPAWLFPIAWTILYILMGLASYFVAMDKYSNPAMRRTGLILYFVQLIFNFAWTLVFFNLGAYLFAFVWLMMMWLIIIACAICFYFVDYLAGFLMIPLILWTTFAAYLNLFIYVLNPL